MEKNQKAQNRNRLLLQLEAWLLKPRRWPFSLQLSLDSLLYFRVALGFFIAVDLLQHFPDVSLLYSDAGLISVQEWLKLSIPQFFSIYTWFYSPFTIHLIYLIHLCLAVAFLSGRGLRWVPTVLWFFQNSLQLRNPLIIDGADHLMVLFLLISQFIPLLGQRRATEEQRLRPWAHHPLWPGVLILQILGIYFCSALLKNNPVWNRDFTAAALALRLDFFTTSFGAWAQGFPGVFLKTLTWMTYALELVGPLIYLVGTNKIKRFVVIAFILFHLMLSACFRLGVFPYLCIAAWIALWPKPHAVSEQTHSSARQTFVFGLGFSYLVLFFYLNASAFISLPRLPPWIAKTSQYIGFNQSWGFFAPWPALDNFQIRATRSQGDILIDAPLNRTFSFQHRHHTKFLLNLDRKMNLQLKSWARLLCIDLSPLSSEKIDFWMKHDWVDKTSLELRRQDEENVGRYLCADLVRDVPI